MSDVADPSVGEGRQGRLPTPVPPDVEAAAVVAALAVVAAERTPPAEPVRSVWADRAAALRAPSRPGPGAWRETVRPR